MIAKRLRAAWPLALVLLVASCGGADAPPNSVITAVESDRTTTYTLNLAPNPVVDGTIHFKVQKAADDPAPVPGVRVEITGTSPSLGDPFAGFVTSLTPGGAFVNPADPSRIETTTNSGGVVSAAYQFTVPKCGTKDVNVSASISAFTSPFRFSISLNCSC